MYLTNELMLIDLSDTLLLFCRLFASHRRISESDTCQAASSNRAAGYACNQKAPLARLGSFIARHSASYIDGSTKEGAV